MMLERASLCLETGGRQLLRGPKPCIHSRRMLHASFWHHGASDLVLPAWGASAHDHDHDHGRSRHDLDETGYTKEAPNSAHGLLLDFLYPEKTLSLLRSFPTFGPDGIELRRRPPMLRGGVRRFSTTGWSAARIETAAPGPMEAFMQEEVEERLLHASPLEALQQLIKAAEEGKQELAWRLYQAVPDSQRSPLLSVDVLDYLHAPGPALDPNRMLGIFDAIPRHDRRPSSYRAAIAAYLALGLIGPAVEAHDVARERLRKGNVGTDLILERTVRGHQWELGVRVLKTLVVQARGTQHDLKKLYTDTRRQEDDFVTIWGAVARLPYLRGHLESFLLHIEQFKHELLATQDSIETVQHFLHGMIAEITEQLIHGENVDDQTFWDFLVPAFARIRALGLSNAGLYEYIILRLANIPRFQRYTNHPKVHLELYRLYRIEVEETEGFSGRPSAKLIRKLALEHGVMGSVSGVESLVGDFRTYHPGEVLPFKLIKYLLGFYADLGQVDRVEEYLQQFLQKYRPQLDLFVLINLPYAYARRVDIQGTERQFARITDEFGQTPDLACWNTLLLAYTRADDLDGALACFNRALASGQTPDIYTFNPLLELCASRGDVEAFEALYSRAEQLRIPIRTDMRSRAGYVLALINYGDIKGAEATAKGMLKSHRANMLKGSLTHTWNLLIQHHALLGDIATSQRLYRDMVDNQIPLDSWTYASLMRALVEVHQTNAAYRILRVTMPANNMKVYGFHYALVIIGFIREHQFDMALRANRRMQQRRVPQTLSSRMASLSITGLTDLHKLGQEKNSDKPARLVELEKSMREILFTDYESDVANREPRHMQIIDSKEHYAPAGYFGLIILLYGSQGALDICKEMFEAATLNKKQDAEAPIMLLTAIMDTHLRAKEYDDVARCWDLARRQASKLTKTLQQVMHPEGPKVEFDSLIDPSIKERAESAPIAVNRRQVLVRAMRTYMASLVERRDRDSLADAQHSIRDLLVNGFVVDSLTWNMFIQELARRGRIVDAFSACEAYLMPAFPGWRELNPDYQRKEIRGHEWIMVRHADLTPSTVMPRYKTLVVLAAAYAQLRREDVDGLGYKPEMGGYALEVLEQLSPDTVRAIETMPRTGDRLQRKYLGDML